MCSRMFIFLFLSLLLSGFNLSATEKHFSNTEKEEDLKQKLEGYKTTLTKSEKVLYRKQQKLNKNTSDEIFQSFNKKNKIDINFEEVFKHEAIGSNSFETLINGFRNDAKGIFTQDNSLLDELSSPRSQLINKNYLSQPGVSRGNGNGNNAGKSSSGSNKNYNSGDKIERPVLIAWFFDSISYVRTNPLWSGFLALLFFGVISGIQIVIVKLARPFG